MTTLVVPVDGSENSVNAAHYAADMALAIDADIHLLHVVKIIFTPSVIPTGYVFEEMENAGTTLLQKLSADLKERTRGQVTITTLLETGGVEFQIDAVCRRIHPFAVVMGAPEGSFTRAISGSPVLDAARRLPYPVLVIPPGASFRRIHTIVMACLAKDITGEIPLTVSFLRRLKELFDSTFDIIHIETDTERNEGMQSFGLYRWRRALEEISPALHFLPGTTVPKEVERYLAESQADWLMVFPQKHGLLEFHKSRSNPLILNCPIPVLSLSEPALAEQAEEAKANTSNVH